MTPLIKDNDTFAKDTALELWRLADSFAARAQLWQEIADRLGPNCSLDATVNLLKELHADNPDKWMLFCNDLLDILPELQEQPEGSDV